MLYDPFSSAINPSQEDVDPNAIDPAAMRIAFLWDSYAPEFW